MAPKLAKQSKLSKAAGEHGARRARSESQLLRTGVLLTVTSSPSVTSARVSLGSLTKFDTSHDEKYGNFHQLARGLQTSSAAPHVLEMMAANNRSGWWLSTD